MDEKPKTNPKNAKNAKNTKNTKDATAPRLVKVPGAAKEAKPAEAPTLPKEPAATQEPAAVKPVTPKAPAKPKTAPKPKTAAKPKTPAKPKVAAAGLDILMITSEARPFAKTGGLADVCGALPRALARLGHHVTIVLPRYRGTTIGVGDTKTAEVPLGTNRYPVTFIEQPLEPGVMAVLIDAPDLYDRDGLYGDAAGEFTDNAFRFAVLSRGALEYARLRGRRPAVIHAHDWQAALAPVYAKTELAADPIIGGVRTVLTIHNLAFQGNFDARQLQWLGLAPGLLTPAGLEFWGRASALKGGVVFSDAITTVSPTYAREILQPEFGFGFNGILASRAGDLVGILNGIDTDVWNPETDLYLPAHFTAANLAAKRDVKRTLLETAGLPADEATVRRPLIGIVTRLTHQKGCDIVAAAANELMQLDASWVMLGSGDTWCEELWRQLADRHPQRVAARIGFDERLSHLIEGGSDLFLMPSWYEPCGLNQMYSLRYGTLPIVRATGGLADTVVDADQSPDGGTGFTFRDYAANALIEAVTRALAVYKTPGRWERIQRAAMRQDFSWDVSAREYVKVYVATV